LDFRQQIIIFIHENAPTYTEKPIRGILEFPDSFPGIYLELIRKWFVVKRDPPSLVSKTARHCIKESTLNVVMET
jgi:hypothetical protein